jgi:predicted esterase
MVLVHGRGATARSILELGSVLEHPDFAYLAPQAQGNTWYPYSFLAPMSQNEPGITSGLQAVADAVASIEMAGIPAEKIIIGGFSQGACLASEFVARYAQRYGGLLAFSGGLIGPPGTPRDYAGTLDGMPAFIGCSDIDPHIPLERVTETADILAKLKASVNMKIYPGMGHTINQDEIDQAMAIVQQVATG